MSGNAAARSARVLVPLTKRTPAVVLLTDDGVVDLYTVCEMPPPGPEVRLFEAIGVRPRDAGTEQAARRYQVLVRRPLPGRKPMGECTCAGGTYRGTVVACRHLSALHALWEANSV